MRRRSFGLTRRGWTLAGAAVGLLLGGRVLGADELSVLGLAAVAALVGAVAWVGLARRSYTIDRQVEPARLHVGDPARVDLTVRASRPTPLLDLVEPIDDGRLSARFLVAPIAPGGEVTPAYRLPTDRRGTVALGPATVLRTDPLGLARRRRKVGERATVLVRPRVLRVPAPSLGAGRRLAVEDATSTRAPSADSGGEFLAVRPYEVGDDPRRVHWRSSARTDDLMVRQFVAPRQGYTLVVLDTRDPAEPGPETTRVHATTPEFERAVEATASVVAALHRARRPVECLTTSGTVLGHPGGDPQRTFDRLAVVMPDEADLLDAVAHARQRRPPELVILVSSRVDARVQHARRVLARRTASLLVVTGGETPAGRAPGSVVDARTTPFPDAWRAALGSRHARVPSGRPSPVPAWTSAAPSHPRSRSAP